MWAVVPVLVKELALVMVIVMLVEVEVLAKVMELALVMVMAMPVEVEVLVKVTMVMGLDLTIMVATRHRLEFNVWLIINSLNEGSKIRVRG